MCSLQQVTVRDTNTNIVFVEVRPERSQQLSEHLASRDMLIGSASTVRLVTHLDVDAADIDRFAGEVEAFFERAA